MNTYEDSFDELYMKLKQFKMVNSTQTIPFRYKGTTFNISMRHWGGNDTRIHITLRYSNSSKTSNIELLFRSMYDIKEHFEDLRKEMIKQTLLEL